MSTRFLRVPPEIVNSFTMLAYLSRQHRYVILPKAKAFHSWSVLKCNEFHSPDEALE